MYGGGGGGQWPGQQQQQQQRPTGYMQPQATGYMGMQQQRPMMTGMTPQQGQSGFMNPQATGMGMGMGGGMMPQATGMGMGMGMMGGAAGLGGMRQPSYGQPSGMMGAGQQRFLSPQPMQMQPTGMMHPSSPRPGMGGLQPQATGYPGGPMGMQPTGLMPQMTGMPLDPRMQLMSAQFLPSAQPYSGAPMPGNMNFSSAQMQPSNFQSQIQNLSQQQQGSKEPKIPWALSKDERKSYDQIFRAWDQKGTGFLNGEVAQEVFGQSGLDRDKLMQVWHLADTENRGKLNLAEFHVAMGLIYRALNGNEIPEHLPPELVPPSAKDLSESVDFLKDLLKRDVNVRQTTALNLPEAGSNSGANYGKSRSFHENPIQKQDAAAYKHTDEVSTGYKSSARHLDRRTVRYGGESPADDLTEMKHQLAHTQRMLESHAETDDDDREVEREMEELRFRIKRVQDDIDYYNRRGGRDAAENRRKAERELLHLMHERLPLLEKRLDQKDKKKREKKLDESHDRDRRNEEYMRGGRYSDYGNSRSQTPTQRDHDRASGRGEDSRSPPPPPPASMRAPQASKPAPAPPASPSVAAVAAPAPAPAPASPSSSGPPKNMTPEERQAWIRSEAQRRIAERMRALGAAAPSSTIPAADSSVEQRLAADKAEAEARAAQADAEAAAREEARRARLEEQRVERERAAVSTIKTELKEQEKSDNPPPTLVMQAAREEVNEQEEMLRRREEVLQKEKEERLARFKKLEEEEAEAKRQEEAFQQRQAQFQGQPPSNLPAPVRKGKGGPPPPPPSRTRAPPPPAPAPAPPTASSAPAPPPPKAEPAGTTETAAVSPLASTPSGNASTNPFHRMQQPNGAAPSTPGGTNPFYRQQQATESALAPNLPAPQRSTAPAAGVAPGTGTGASSAVPRRSPDDDDDWGESEHGDHEDDDPDGPGSTSRATRQNLAAALFSNLVPTPPTSASPAPPAAPPAPPAATPAPPAPEAPAAPTAPPAAPPAPAASVAAPKGGAPDRGALLGAIRGGLSLRSAQTNDRSTAGVAGRVIGDASAPVQKFVPPPSPPAEPAQTSDAGDESTDRVRDPHRQSVDWAGSLATEQMHSHTKASAVPEEPSLREEEEDSSDGQEGPEDVDKPSLASGHVATSDAPAVNGSAQPDETPADELDDFDVTKTVRVRTLYPYEAQRDEDLGFLENTVLMAHPAKDAGSDWWYGTVLTDPTGKKGTFPRAYVQSIDQPKIAKALYDFQGSSPEEMSFSADQQLHIVDDEDESWWKVVDEHDRILIVPATYVELVASG